MSGQNTLVVTAQDSQVKRPSHKFNWQVYRDTAVAGSGTYKAMDENGNIEFIGGFGLSPAAPYKRYVATLTQAGIAAPVATVLENNIGAIVWSRIGQGVYTATLVGAFTANKTHIMINNLNGSNDAINAVRTDANSITVNTSTVNFVGGSFDSVDGVLNETSIEIRVYL